MARLEVLHRLKKCFDMNGARTKEGHVLYQQHFTGGNAWFSDESAANQADFGAELTFPNPDAPGETLFCSWHGKVKTPQYRIHFSWPVTAASPPVCGLCWAENHQSMISETPSWLPFTDEQGTHINKILSEALFALKQEVVITVPRSVI